MYISGNKSQVQRYGTPEESEKTRLHHPDQSNVGAWKVCMFHFLADHVAWQKMVFVLIFRLGRLG